MAFNKKNQSISLIIILTLLTALPVIATTNINCIGKAFHCVNSTHFKICVDFGGVSQTVDDYLIPCPPSTVCTDSNYFECEYEITSTPTTLSAYGNDVTIFLDIFATAHPMNNNEKIIELSKKNTASSKFISEAAVTDTTDFLNYTFENGILKEVSTNSEKEIHKTPTSHLSENKNIFVKPTDTDSLVDIKTVTTKKTVIDAFNDTYHEIDINVPFVALPTEHYFGIKSGKNIELQTTVTEVPASQQSNVNFTLITTANNDNASPESVMLNNILHGDALHKTNDFLSPITTSKGGNIDLITFTTDSYLQNIQDNEKTSNVATISPLNRNEIYTHAANVTNVQFSSTSDIYNDNLRSDGLSSVRLKNIVDYSTGEENITPNPLIPENRVTKLSANIFNFNTYIDTYELSNMNPAISTDEFNKSVAEEIPRSTIDFLLKENDIYFNKIEEISTSPKADFTSTMTTFNEELRSTTARNIAFDEVVTEFSMYENNDLPVLAKIKEIPEEFVIKLSSDVVKSTINSNPYTTNDLKIWEINPTMQTMTKYIDKFATKTENKAAVTTFDVIIHENGITGSKLNEMTSIFPNADITTEINVHNDEFGSTAAENLGLEMTKGVFSTIAKNDSSLSTKNESKSILKNIISNSASNIGYFETSTNLYDIKIHPDKKTWAINPTTLFLINANEFYTSATEISPPKTVLDFIVHKDGTDKSKINKTPPLLLNSDIVLQENTHNDEVSSTTIVNMVLDNVIDKFPEGTTNDLLLSETTTSNLIPTNIVTRTPDLFDLKLHTDSYHSNTQPNTKLRESSPTEETSESTAFNFVIDKNDTHRGVIHEISVLPTSGESTFTLNIDNEKLSSTTAINISFNNTVKDKSDLAMVNESDLIIETTRSKLSSHLFDLKIKTDSYDANAQIDTNIRNVISTMSPSLYQEFYSSTTKKSPERSVLDNVTHENDTYTSETDQTSSLLQSEDYTTEINRECVKLGPMAANAASMNTIEAGLEKEDNDFNLPEKINESYSITTKSEARFSLDLSITTDSYSAIKEQDKKVRYVMPTATSTIISPTTANELYVNIANDTTNMMGSDVLTYQNELLEKTTGQLFQTNYNHSSSEQAVSFSEATKDRNVTFTKHPLSAENNNISNLLKTTIFSSFVQSDNQLTLSEPSVTPVIDIVSTEKNTDLIYSTMQAINKLISPSITRDREKLNSTVDKLRKDNYSLKDNSLDLSRNIEKSSTNFVDAVINGTLLGDKEQYKENINNTTTRSASDSLNNKELKFLPFKNSTDMGKPIPLYNETNLTVKPFSNLLNRLNMASFNYTKSITKRNATKTNSENNIITPDLERVISAAEITHFVKKIPTKNDNITTTFVIPINITKIKELTTPRALKSGHLNIQDQQLRKESKDFNKESIIRPINGKIIVNDSKYHLIQNTSNSNNNNKSSTKIVKNQVGIIEPILEPKIYLNYANDSLQTSKRNISEFSIGRKNERYNVSISKFNYDHLTISTDQNKEKNILQNVYVHSNTPNYPEAVKTKKMEFNDTLNTEFSVKFGFLNSNTSTREVVNKGNYPVKVSEIKAYDLDLNKTLKINSDSKSNTTEYFTKKRTLKSMKQVGLVNKTESKDYDRAMLQSQFNCSDRYRGRYSDKKDCQKFYICIGKNEPIVGKCPNSTVFSEILKQCTKNLSHCIRNNQFKCVSTGRYVDIFSDNFYYICAKKAERYIRFKLQCQKGYHLNRIILQCVLDSLDVSISKENSSHSNENKSKVMSTSESKSKEVRRLNKKKEFECKKEGKFVYPEDCRKYYECTKSGKSEFRRKIKKCDSDKVFKKKKCVDEDSYECNE